MILWAINKILWPIMMKTLWNWQKKDWPHFTYDASKIIPNENKFHEQSGISFGISKHLKTEDEIDLMINLMTDEAYKTSEIEGEILDRASLQSSIKRHFGLKAPLSKNHPAENGIAEMMHDLYLNFDKPLTHHILHCWHAMLMSGRRDLDSIGTYRTHAEPMQIISGYIGKPKIHFEAPPSDRVHAEMEAFINWFNDSSPKGKKPLSPLIRASITHLYFESIHPYEDGNGRIGRALVEKSLAQHVNRPTLIALSQIINDHKKSYYEALSQHSKSNEITDWILSFSETVLRAQEFTIKHIEFLIQKAKFFEKYKEKLNERQLKIIKRMMQEGPEGFKGGLSAKNYMTITKTSPSTATRDLHELVKLKILKQKGEKKATRYTLCLPP